MTTKTRPFKPGDRVVDVSGFFGAGAFEQYDWFGDYALVTWDTRPPTRYNLGMNPCMIHPSQLQKERADAVTREKGELAARARVRRRDATDGA